MNIHVNTKHAVQESGIRLRWNHDRIQKNEMELQTFCVFYISHFVLIKIFFE